MITQKTSKTSNNLILYLILALLFLMSMNFKAKFFYFAFGSVLVYLSRRFNLRLNYSFVLYFLVSVIMSYFNFENGIMAMIRVFASAAVYVLGFNLILDASKNKAEEEKAEVLKRLFLMVFTVALGTSIHFILNFIINYGEDLGRNTYDIWSGQITSATNQATIACIMSGLSCALFIFSNKALQAFVLQVFFGFFCLSGLRKNICILLSSPSGVVPFAKSELIENTKTKNIIK